jgi:hypothetical protein
MDSTRSLSTKQRLFVVCSFVLGATLLSTAALSSSARRSQREVSLPIVKDNTGSFGFIGLERLDGRFEARMQNTSKKAITAYVTAVCDVPESSTDYTIGDHLIEPGEIENVTVPNEAVPDKCGSTITQPTITILAVVFEDRTYAGEFQLAKSILDDRRGDKIQLKRINRLLAEALKGPDAGEPAAIERLKTEIAALPVDEGEPPAVRGGLSIAKQRALYLLDELKQWHQKSLTSQSRRNIPIQGELAGIDSLPEGIQKLVRLNEKWISRY